MSDRRTSSRWMELAVRVRQWSLDEQIPTLRHALMCEEQSRQAREQAEAAVTAAGEARGTLLRQQSFDAAAFQRQSVFEAEQRRRSSVAQSDEEEASSAVDAIRDDMQRLLAERDAFRSSAERARESARVGQERAAIRQVDELWLLQRSTTTGEADDEG